ncbi:hypothetical protein Bca4012_056778 [Brassica carinata]|uniref:TIR domain-containing protein n=1 Tax=Brassica carinata TaxID=52824 RepID=A0A8X7W2H6_BRACI|nr:hypothetical protein Bca52824_015689 [Brassica carinata]
MSAEVFLSFRGQDVRKTFVSHLYRDFSQKGIKSFLNEEDGRDQGKQILPALLRAISESKVAVVVLSKYYASSVWCLDELVKIMIHARRKMTAVVPIFYEVNSSDVRHQTGSFGEDFKRHGQRENPETLQRWRDALINLTNADGFSSDTSEDDSKLVRDITRHVSGLLSESRLQKKLLPGDNKSTAKKTSSGRLVSNSDKLMAPISEISNSLVTMDRHMEPMHKLLKLHSTREIRVVGISGFRGIGKTTIARFIHQKLSPAFQSHSFLDTSGTQGIGKTSILSSLYQKSFPDHCLTENSKNIHDKGLINRASSSGSRDEVPSPRGLKRKTLQTSSDLGSDDKRTMFWNQRALVIVDNVETIKQVKEIMKDVSWLGPGSRVIITTQDKSLLLDCGVEHVYDVDYLRYDEALELFSLCAFKKQYPPENFEQLSVRAVQLTGCLPLGLKLLGSFLCGKTKDDWESEVKSLEAKQGKAILELLKINVQGVPHGRTKEVWEREVQMHEEKKEKKKKIKPLLNY